MPGNDKKPAAHLVILRGTVGSHAYNMATDTSDVDRLGIYALPTEELHGLRVYTDADFSDVRHNPDITYHEVGKFCRLTLKCNPATMELLWLTADGYDHLTYVGMQLISIRERFLSAPKVRDAYLNYAHRQWQRIERTGRFASVPVDRVAKHARHLYRLVIQGTQLWLTGKLALALDDPAEAFAVGERAAAGDLEPAKTLMDVAHQTFTNSPTPLPDEPDRETIEETLRIIRQHFLRLSSETAGVYQPPEVTI